MIARNTDGGRGQQTARVLEARVDVDGGEEAEVADLDEALGKDMLEKAANEFDRVARRGGLAAGAKDDAIGVGADEAGVGNGDAMGVAPEVTEDLRGAAERTFDVDDPALLVEARASAGRGPIVGIVVQLAAGAEFGEAGQEFAAEERAEHVDGEEKVRCGRDPVRAVEREAAAGDEAVDVRMKRERARPGVSTVMQFSPGVASEYSPPS